MSTEDPTAASNEAIERARQAALAALAPSAAELEHGLALHEQSLVCDTYGFAPRAAPDGAALKAASEAGASEAELRDLSEEMSMTGCVVDDAAGEEFREAFRAAGVTCIFQNAGVESQAPLEILKRLARFTYVGDRMPHFLLRATAPADIERAHAEGKHCLYLSSNGVPLAQQWVSVEEELGYVRLFFQLGVRMMHLTYNRRNMIGDGCAEPGNAGLSDFGRAVIAEMNRVGVIVDVAHAGWRTSLEAARASDRPVVASHSACAAVNEHIRAKPDEVIAAIAETGGYIGICCVPRFLGGAGDIRALMAHIDHVVKRFGADHVTIGTDVAYTSRRAAAEQQKLPRRPRTRARWEGFWPPGALGDSAWRQPQMVQSLAWTNWPLFTVGLVQLGYSDEAIQKILGGNMLRVARAVLADRP
ncbi:MAG TPA: membrane dipeptidase [Limnochordia bacterium]|nr:membrane dipeptidase [Limnochordia bacterium]